MIWFIKRGDTISRSEPIRRSFTRHFEEGFSDYQLLTTETLCICKLPQAPVYPSKMTPIHVKCVSDFRGLPRDKLEKITGKDGKTYYRLSFYLVLLRESATFRFECRDADDKVMGSVETSYQ